MKQFELIKKFSTIESTISWLQRLHLLHNERICPNCFTEMSIQPLKSNKNIPYVWRCTICKNKKSIYSETFFEYS